MPFFRRTSIVLLAALTLVSCRRDPNVVKQQYLDSGNKYFDHGRYKQAAIQYQNAIKIDRKFGPAYYRLALVYMKMTPPQINTAIHQFRRAVELLEGNQAYQEEYKASLVQLSELDLAFLARDRTVLKDVEDYCAILFKKDPNSFEATRLTGDLNFTKYLQAGEAGPTVANGFLDTAMEYYRKADAIKPGDVGVLLQIGKILARQKQYAEAEPYFRRVIDTDKTSYLGIMNLYTVYMTEQKTADAEKLLKEAIQNNPKSHEYLERLAYHYGTLGRRDDMLNVLAQIKSHAKDFEAVYRVVGDFYYRIGDVESAKKSLNTVLQIDPNHKDAQRSIDEIKKLETAAKGS